MNSEQRAIGGRFDRFNNRILVTPSVGHQILKLTWKSILYPRTFLESENQREEKYRRVAAVRLTASLTRRKKRLKK
jgi:hypothetical protein